MLYEHLHSLMVVSHLEELRRETSEVLVELDLVLSRHFL